MTRIQRSLSMLAVAACALSHAAQAQQGRPFEDSWFWGLKTGVLAFGDSAGAYRQAPFPAVADGADHLRGLVRRASLQRFRRRRRPGNGEKGFAQERRRGKHDAHRLPKRHK